MCLQINKPFSPELVTLLFSSPISASDMCNFFGQIMLLPTHFSALPQQTQGLTFHDHTEQNNKNIPDGVQGEHSNSTNF